MIVDFPDPLGPTKATVWPGLTSIEKFLKTYNNLFVNSDKWSDSRL